MVAVDLDASDHRPDDLARAVPVQLVQASTDPLGELVQTAEEQRQVPLCLDVREQPLPLRLEVAQSSPQPAPDGRCVAIRLWQPWPDL